MIGTANGRVGSFSAGATETKFPAYQPTLAALTPPPSGPQPQPVSPLLQSHLQPTQFKAFTPNSVFDQSQVRGSSNGLSGQDYDRVRLGGGMAPSANGASSQTYEQRQWIDKNPARLIGD